MEEYKVAPLLYTQIEESAKDIGIYINKRRKGVIKSLKTRWKKFNHLLSGGFEPQMVYAICASSGGGKSSFLSSLQMDLFELNPNEDFVILNFSLEMISARVTGRMLSYKLQKTTSELYSGGDNKLSDEDFNKVREELTNIKQLPIYTVDTPGTVEQIKQTMLKFLMNEGKGKWVIVTLDHTLLVRGSRGEDERITLANLQRFFIEAKKWGRITIIQLSQLNRNIESVDRISNKSMQYPMRNDIFGGESLMQGSDTIIVLHRPKNFNLASYGPRNLPVENRVYAHIIKNRDGESGSIIAFEDNLKYNRLDEVDLNDISDNKNEIKLVF